MKFTTNQEKTTPGTHFKQKKHYPYNPERLTDNGTLLTQSKTMNKQNKLDNLTRREREALKQLTDNPTLIINKADKGSTIVVQDRSDYIMKHLNNKTTYKRTSHIN